MMYDYTIKNDKDIDDMTDEELRALLEENNEESSDENDESEHDETEDMIDDYDEASDKSLEDLIGNESDEEDNKFGNKTIEEDYESTDADSSGAIVSRDLLMAEEEETGSNSFISDSGDIVVMNNSDSEGFRLLYLDIENIVISDRIRLSQNVDSLVKSIKSTGLLEPIVVGPTMTEGMYVLIHGFRRLIACAKCGIRKIPCIVNTKVNTPEITVLEALYNHSKRYSIKEMVAYIDFLEKEKGIVSSSMIEYLLQLNSGEYSKLKDILNDNDDDIVSKLYDGLYDIDTAYRKLEQRRKKESSEEKENKKAERVYGDSTKSGAEAIEGSGEQGEEELALTDEELKGITVSAEGLDEGLEDANLGDMIKEGDSTPGFEAHKQKVGEREYIDPAVRKTVMARDNFTCAACKRGGESFVDALDYHHIVPVFLGGEDTPDNGVTLCLTCHRLVHLYSTGDLHLPKEKTENELSALSEDEQVIYKDEQMRFKRIVRLGQVIRNGISKRGLKREEYKKMHPIGSIGRNRPGRIQEKA